MHPTTQRPAPRTGRPGPLLLPRLMACGLVGALFAIHGCRTPAKPLQDLVVTSFAPDASRDGEDTPPLRFQFDQPVVSEEEVGKPLASPPVSLDPSVEIAAHWEDRQTLVILPKSALNPSERYQVTLTGALGERVGKSSFSFVHRPLVVEGLEGIDESRLSTNPELVLRFNQPVKAADVVRACAFKESGSQKTISLSTPDPKKIDERISLSSAKTLAQDQDYTLVCEELTGARGSAPLKEPYEISLHTYPPLQIVSFTPEKTENIETDAVYFEIAFSTPVTREDLRKYISIEPAVPGFDRGWLDYEGLRYSVEVNLEPQTAYTVRVKESMADIYNQKIKAAEAFTFKTGDAPPLLRMERGIYAVESSNPDYPVWTRNLTDFKLECSHIPQKQIVELLTSEMDYDPWYNAESKNTINWKKYGLSAKKHTVSAKAPRNEWALSSLSLKDLCGGKNTSGLFLAEMSSDEMKPNERHPWRHRPQQRVLANVTDLGVLLKAGASSGLVWVTRLSDGTPVENAKVTVYSPKGRLAHRGSTDKSGLLTLPGAAKLLAKDRASDGEQEYYGYRSQRLIAIVESGEELAVVDGNWANGIQTWNFGVPEDRSSNTTAVRGFIQSDRGIYRPGETVHFKGIVREIALGKSPRVPARATAAVTVQDSRGAKIYEAELSISAFGGFHFELPLMEEASLGDYYVNAKIKDQTFQERFQVEEFRKVTYELKLKADQKVLMTGDAAEFTLQADYLFGAPVKNARVQWDVQRRSHSLYFPDFPQYSFQDYATLWGDSWWYEPYDSTSFISSGEGTTDREGVFEFSIKDPEERFSGPQDYLAKVIVTDSADETISKQIAVTAHRSDFYLGLHAQEYVQAVDMPFAVNTIAIAPDGKQVSTGATINYIRKRYDCSSRKYYFDPCKVEKKTLWSRKISVPATGVSTEEILPKDPGSFIIEVESKDSRGNRVVASTYVWVLGKGEAFWSGDESVRMPLITSKESYKPGEDARLVPLTSLSGGTALVTLERDGVLEARITKLSSSGEGVTVSLDKSHAPNVFASVAIVQGRSGKGDKHRPRFQMGVVDLKVPAEDNRLKVEIETEEAAYEPGQEVSGVIRVTHEGKPVDAEVSLSVADEGVLQLIAYKTPDPMKTFYKSFGLGVDNGTNWNRVAQLKDPRKSLLEQGGDGPAGGEDAGRIRSKFVSSAFWEPLLRTNNRGEIAFRFTAPDNLTAFRLMAVAADKSVRFGSSDARIRVRKLLQASPKLPRFLNKGDKSLVGVMVQNNSPHDGVAVVRASAKGARLLDKEVKEVKVEAGGSARVRFESAAEDVREASFTFKVEMDNLKDAVQVSIPVQRSTIIERSTLSQGAVKKSVSVPLSWKSGLLEEDSFVEISVDRTGLGELQESLRHLIEYPYGCLEQTLSRFIPLTKVQDLADSMGFENLKGEKLKKFIRAGVAKVIRHQNYSGYFSLWPNGQTYPHLTVYAMFGLTEAKEAGIEVDDSTMNRGTRAIKEWVNDPKRVLGPGGESATMAMAAYVLAYMGKADSGLNARLFEVRQGLAVYGQAFLLSALHKAGGPKDQIKTLQEELVAQIQVDGDTAFVEEKDANNLRWYMSSNVRSSAITLSALLAVDPKNKSIEALAEGLKKEMKPGGYWSSTQDNLYALIALSDYARQKTRGSTRVTLSLDGEALAKEELKGGEILTVKRSLRDLKQGTLSLEADGEARHSVRMTLVSEDSAKDPIDKGFSVSRRYIDPETGKELSSFQAGQLIKVELTVKTDEDRAWVALVDPMPAGFEAVNLRLATSQGIDSSGVARQYGSYYYRYLWTHTELRDDRMMAFSDYLPKGTRTLQYLARASTAGAFTAGPTFVEAMYEPEVYGRGTSVTVEVAR